MNQEVVMGMSTHAGEDQQQRKQESVASEEAHEVQNLRPRVVDKSTQESDTKLTCTESSASSTDHKIVSTMESMSLLATMDDDKHNNNNNNNNNNNKNNIDDNNKKRGNRKKKWEKATPSPSSTTGQQLQSSAHYYSEIRKRKTSTNKKKRTRKIKKKPPASQYEEKSEPKVPGTILCDAAISEDFLGRLSPLPVNLGHAVYTAKRGE